MTLSRLFSSTAAALLSLSALFQIACNGAKSVGATGAAAAESGASASRSKAAPTPITSIDFRHGGCFGTCPVYSLRVMPDGSATYDGKQYAPYKGQHVGTVPADTVRELLRLSEAVLAKADELPREIDTGIADHSYSTVTVATATDTLEFTGTTEFAPPVDTLRRALMQLSEGVAWALAPGATPPPPNEIRLRLKSSDQIQVVQENFFRQQFRVLELEDKATSTFRVSFDAYAMEGEMMVEELERLPEVVSAELIGGDGR